MTTLRNLNRAVQSAEFPSHEFAQAVREMLNEIAERMEPTSEGAKVECPNCRKMAGNAEHFHYSPAGYTCQPAQPEPAAPEYVATPMLGFPCENCGQQTLRKDGHVSHRASGDETEYYCDKPAQPEPVAKQDVCAQCSPGRGHNADWSEAFGKQPSKLCGAIGDDGRCALVYDHPGLHSSKPEPAAPVGEMPEAVRLAIYHLRVDAETYRNRMQEECAAANKRTAAALETFWREHATPPKVAMTEDLERNFDRLLAQLHAAIACLSTGSLGFSLEATQEVKKAAETASDILAAVRTQAAGVKLEPSK